MHKDSLFKKYYTRLMWEGIIKSLILGLIAGFAAGGAFGLVAILSNNFATASNYNSAAFLAIMISLGIMLIIAAALTPVLYFLVFKPKTKQIMGRVDRLGLEERLITMEELKNDKSFIAMLQREDAKQNLIKVNPKRLKIAAFMLVPTILASIMAATYMSTIIVSAVSTKPPVVWESLGERQPVLPPKPDPDAEFKYWVAEYIAIGGGYIDGDAYQVVVDGEDAAPVVARPMPGFGFVDWISGLEKPEKQDLDVREDLFDAAQFQPEDEGDDESEDEDPQPQPQPQPDDEEPELFDPDLIINGTEKYYDEEIFNYYLDKALAILAAGEELSPGLRLFLELYFHTLQQ